jgi:hypothetical protein
MISLLCIVFSFLLLPSSSDSSALSLSSPCPFFSVGVFTIFERCLQRVVLPTFSGSAA